MRTEWEIERKFVVTFVPEGLLETRQPVTIRQGYISTESDRHIHILDEGGKYTMTIDQGVGHKRQETQIAISAEQFDQLWPLTQNMRVENQRYRIGFFGHSLMFDVFEGHLSPLMMVEVEFDSAMNSRQFLPPDFAEFEVTHQREYQHIHLAKFGLPDSLALASCHY